MADSFNKYLDLPHPRTPSHLAQEQLQLEIESINSTLASLFPDRQRLGDLFSP
jgi:hypothetical protein